MSNVTRRHLIGAATGLALMLSAGAVKAAGETIALVTINQQALFFNQINDGAQAAADKNGVKLVMRNDGKSGLRHSVVVASFFSGVIEFRIGMWCGLLKPGARMFTRTRGATDRARHLLKVSTPPFAAP